MSTEFSSQPDNKPQQKSTEVPIRKETVRVTLKVKPVTTSVDTVALADPNKTMHLPTMQTERPGNSTILMPTLQVNSVPPPPTPMSPGMTTVVTKAPPPVMPSPVLAPMPVPVAVSSPAAAPVPKIAVAAPTAPSPKAPSAANLPPVVPPGVNVAPPKPVAPAVPGRPVAPTVPVMKSAVGAPPKVPAAKPAVAPTVPVKKAPGGSDAPTVKIAPTVAVNRPGRAPAPTIVSKASSAQDALHQVEAVDPEAGLMPLSVVAAVAAVILLFFQFAASDLFMKGSPSGSAFEVISFKKRSWEVRNETTLVVTDTFNQTLEDFASRAQVILPD